MFTYFVYIFTYLIIAYIIIKKYDQMQKINLKLCYNKNVMRLNSKENEKNMIEFINKIKFLM